LIDLKQELEDYAHIDAETLGYKDGIVPDNVRNAVNLYNKALDSIRAKSEDMAIIELKKSISLTPEFYQAMDLLGICYLYINDYNNARSVYEKLIELKGNNVKTTRLHKFMKDMEASSSKKEIKISTYKNTSKNTSVNEENAKIKNNRRSITGRFTLPNGNLIKCICCGLVGAIIVLLCSIPAYLNKTDSSPVNTVDEQAEIISELNTQVAELKNSLSSLRQDYDTLKNNNDLLEKELDYNKNLKKLDEAEILANSKNYEAAADILVLMKDVKFNDEDKQKYDKLFQEVVPKAANAVYNQGYSLCNSRKYNEAIEKLNKVRLYGDQWPFMDSALYKLGVAYKGINNTKESLEIFQTVVNSYPKSQLAYYAKARINEITNQSN